jgi:hypothetical protein
MTYNNLILLFLLIVGGLSAQKDGDIVFRKDKVFTQWNSIGIIFIEDSTPMVYYSDGRVNRTTLKNYINHKKFDIKRIDEEGFIDNESAKNMHIYVKAKLDIACGNISFVWDIYRQELGVPLCKHNDKTIKNIYKCYFLESLDL